MSVTAWIVLTFFLGVLLGSFVMHLLRLASGVDEQNARLRLAFARAVSSMCENAAESDGFTDREISIISDNAWLIGMTWTKKFDDTDEPRYVIDPLPSTVVRLVAAELDREFPS